MNEEAQENKHVPMATVGSQLINWPLNSSSVLTTFSLTSYEFFFNKFLNEK